MSGEWTDKMAGARMQVDQRFNEQVRDSQFSNQQWGLIMTAVEFEIEDPDTPAEAALVANTEKVPQILPELENIQQGMGGPGGQRGGGRDGDGLLGKLRGLFSGGDDDTVDQEKLEAATGLVSEYATELQEFLEEQGQWEELCESAAN